MAKWAALLGEHKVWFKSWTAMKGQVLADFFIDFLPALYNAYDESTTPEDPWKLFVDGVSNNKGQGPR